MGGVPTKIRDKNSKAKPTAAQQHPPNRNACLVSVTTKHGQLVCGKREGKEQWDVFDVPFHNDKSRSKKPERFRNGPCSLDLTREKIFEKLAQAERNRLLHLEGKKKIAAKLADKRNGKDVVSDHKRLAKAKQLAEKYAKAADNRLKQLEHIKTVAKRSRGAICGHCRTRIQRVFVELEKKMKVTQENRQRIVENVVRRQRLREQHAQNVRDKAQRLNTEAADELTDLEVDSNYNASGSSDSGSGTWNND